MYHEFPDPLCEPKRIVNDELWPFVTSVLSLISIPYSPVHIAPSSKSQLSILLNPIETNFLLSVISKPLLLASEPIDRVNASREMAVKASFPSTINLAVFKVNFGKLNCASAAFEDTYMPSLVSNSGKSIVVKRRHESIFNSPPIVASLLDDTLVNFVFDDTSKLLETCVNSGKESEVNFRFPSPVP